MSAKIFQTLQSYSNLKTKHFRPPPRIGPPLSRLYQWVLICAFLLPTNARSQISYQTGAFSQSWEDWHLTPLLRNTASPQNLKLRTQTTSSPLHITRTYNSRSIDTGVFGFGWCAHFEDHLVIEEKTIKTVDCLAINDSEFTRSAGKYRSSLRPLEYIKRTKNLWERKLANGQMQYYLMDGRLDSWHSAWGTLKVQYDGLKRVASLSIDRPNGKNKNLHFFYYKDGRHVQKIISGKLNLTYIYDSHRLIKAVDHLGFVYRYYYDEMENLVKVKHGSHVLSQIQYDKNRDLVTDYKQPGQCQKKLYYTKLNSLDFSTFVLETCKDSQDQQSSYEFIHDPVSGKLVSQTIKTKSDQGEKGRTNYFTPQGRLRKQTLWSESFKVELNFDAIGKISSYKALEPSRLPAFTKSQLQNLVDQYNNQ